MSNDKELVCAHLSYQATRTAKISKIRQSAKFWQKIERQLGPFDLVVPKDESGRTRWGLVPFWPAIVLLLFTLEGVLFCLMTVGCIISAVTTLSRLAREMQELREPTAGIPTPAEKTLLALWHLHGSTDSDVSTGQALSILERWIDVLYGHGRAEPLNLANRLNSIAQRHVLAEVNLRLNNPDSSILLAPPFRVLIRELSDELPRYA